MYTCRECITDVLATQDAEYARRTCPICRARLDISNLTVGSCGAEQGAEESAEHLWQDEAYCNDSKLKALLFQVL